MRPLQIAILVVFALFLLITLIAVISSDTGMGIAHSEFVLNWFTRAIGLFVATVAAFALLLAALGKTLTVERIPVLVMAALVGLLLVAANWGLALALAGVVVALIVRPLLPAARGSEPPPLG